mgnify:FL=1
MALGSQKYQLPRAYLDVANGLDVLARDGGPGEEGGEGGNVSGWTIVVVFHSRCSPSLTRTGLVSPAFSTSRHDRGASEFKTPSAPAQGKHGHIYVLELGVNARELGGGEGRGHFTGGEGGVCGSDGRGETPGPIERQSNTHAKN